MTLLVRRHCRRIRRLGLLRGLGRVVLLQLLQPLQLVSLQLVLVRLLGSRGVLLGASQAAHVGCRWQRRWHRQGRRLTCPWRVCLTWLARGRVGFRVGRVGGWGWGAGVLGPAGVFGAASRGVKDAAVAFPLLHHCPPARGLLVPLRPASLPRLLWRRRGGKMLPRR